MRRAWNGRNCQSCGRFANHFYGQGEDDGTTTYVDERCLTPAERRYFHPDAEPSGRESGDA